MYRLKLDNNKYKIIEDLEHGIFKAERYGEEWRDLAGDNLILSLINKIQELENENSTLKDKLRRKQSFICKPLNKEKKEFLKECCGIASSENIDFNKIMKEYECDFN